MYYIRFQTKKQEGVIAIKESPKPGYWAVLPAKVRYDETLRPNAKLLYAEITALSEKTGFCWAKNSYFAELFGLAERTVSDLIGTLEARGYISVEVINDGGTVERRIYTDRPPRAIDKHIAKNSYVQSDQELSPKMSKNGCQDDHIADFGYVPGSQKLLPQVAKNCYQNNMNNNIPPIVPQGGRRSKTSKAKSQPDYKPDRFLKLWDFYPHKKRGHKSRAVAAWERLHPEDKLIDQIARALVIQLKSEEWQRGIGIPHLSTYLNGAYWEDAEDLAAAPGASPAAASGWADDPEVY